MFFAVKGQTSAEQKEEDSMDMTNKEYGQYVNAKSKPSPLGRDMLWAFVVGGLICTVGQALLNLYRNAGILSARYRGRTRLVRSVE